MTVHPARRAMESSGVRLARAEGRPIVALESSVWIQGLPQQTGFEAAQRVLRAVQAEGAEPAILALLDGELRVGLEEAELERLCAQPAEVAKASTRDIVPLLACGKSGATTVSTCLDICVRAGLDVFATGGIGGVHRGDGRDVSADLPALGRSGVLVVSAGAKSLLDIPATLEMLETYGVAVVGYQTDVLPLFYTRQSPYRIPHRVSNVAEAGRLLHTMRSLQWPHAVVLALGCPEEAALPGHEVEDWIEEAHRQAAAQRISGRDITPFVLSYLHRRSDGRTLTANLALLEANAKLAAQVAVAAQMQKAE